MLYLVSILNPYLVSRLLYLFFFIGSQHGGIVSHPLLLSIPQTVHLLVLHGCGFLGWITYFFQTPFIVFSHLSPLYKGLASGPITPQCCQYGQIDFVRSHHSKYRWLSSKSRFLDFPIQPSIIASSYWSRYIPTTSDPCALAPSY